jgi:predicted signal transduction protein with EAL and GGDEF domain
MPTVEVYLPLVAGSADRTVGVFEVYLPYAPIQSDVDEGIDILYRNLIIGLGVLYLLLFGISFSVGRRLRRQIKLNAYSAEHDALTDLPNRKLFHSRVTAELKRGERRGQPTTVAIIDLDRFKTETALMAHPGRAAATLAELDRAGVRLSIDDFGCGQTSLGHLSSPPIHELKIDRSFIADMIDHHGHAAIVHSIVELGHNLGFHVVGEGVETNEVLARLASTGCDVAQGYFFARPMPSEDLIPWLGAHSPQPTVATN